MHEPQTIRLDLNNVIFISDSQFVVSEAGERKVSVAKSESADSGVGGDTLEVQDDQDQDDYSETERRVIRPDDFAVRELLNFDEVTCDIRA